MIKISKTEATKLLVQEMLQPQEDVMGFIREFSALQIDPVNLVAPNHHLVLYARIGKYHPSKLEKLIEEQKIIEVMAKERCFVPSEDFHLYIERKEKFYNTYSDYFLKNSKTIEHVITEIKANGAMSPKMFIGSSLNTKEIWSARKDTTEALNYLWRAGKIVVAKRKGNEKFYDLIENFFHYKIPNKSLTTEEKQKLKILKYLSGMKLTDINDSRIGFGDIEPKTRRKIVSELVEERKLNIIKVDNLKREYISTSDFGKKDLVEIPPTLLPPLDNFLWRRERLEDLWDFRYRWEIYTPETKRKIGPYGMVLVANNTILGQADVKYDRKEGILYLRPFQLANARNFHENLQIAGERLSKQLKAQKLIIKSK